MFNFEEYCMVGEHWKDINGYEGIYQASSFGRIRTVHGKVTETDRHGKRYWKGKIMKSRGNNKVTGYRVSLWKGKEYKEFLVGRLICTAFHGTPTHEKMTVNHKDGNRFNNHADNLEWLTLADNIRHGFENGLYPMHKIEMLVDGERLTFPSHSKASRHIGRSHGYIGVCIKMNREVRTEFGEIVEVIERSD